MKGLIFTCLFLSTTFVFSQSTFTVKELVDIYLTDKENAIKDVEAKGYGPASAEDFRAMFADQDNAVLYSRRQDASKVGLIFIDNKISFVVFSDSVKTFNRIPEELKKLNFELSNQHGDMFKAYVKRKTDYFIMFDIIDDAKEVAVLSVMLKTDRNKIIYAPKR